MPCPYSIWVFPDKIFSICFLLTSQKNSWLNSNVLHPVSRIQYPASSIEHQSCQIRSNPENTGYYFRSIILIDFVV